MPTITSVNSTTWNSTPDNVWRAVPGLTLPLSMANAGPVAITWTLSVPPNGAIVTRLLIDGANADWQASRLQVMSFDQ